MKKALDNQVKLFDNIYVILDKIFLYLLSNNAEKRNECMRVITGKARGRKLYTLSGNDVRPTTDVVKEAVFSIIQFGIEGRVFLDAYAGSGQMGIEALSRGAKKAVFLDSSRQSCEIVRKNLEVTGLSENAVVRNTDTLSYIAGTPEKFDIVFIDPPYRTGALMQTLERITKVMNKGGVIICEHPADEKMPGEIQDFVLKKEYKYGKIMITVYSHKEVEGI